MHGSSRCNVAVIGCGAHSHSSHLGPLSRIAGVTIHALCDANPVVLQAAMQRFGVERGYAHHEQMLAAVSGSLDAVCVILHPWDGLAAAAGDCLRSGIPTSIEKPPANDMAELEALLQVARQTGTRHMVGFDRRFDPVARRARDLMAVGTRPRHLVGRFYRNRPEETGIGAFVHAVDTILWLGGRWVAIETLAAGPDGFHALLEFEDGGVAALSALRDAGADLEQYEIHGDRASANFDVLNGTGMLRSAAHPDGLDLGRHGGEDSKQLEAACFIDWVRSGSSMSPTLEDAHRTMSAVVRIRGASRW